MVGIVHDFLFFAFLIAPLYFLQNGIRLWRY